MAAENMNIDRALFYREALRLRELGYRPCGAKLESVHSGKPLAGKAILKTGEINVDEDDVFTEDYWMNAENPIANIGMWTTNVFVHDIDRGHKYREVPAILNDDGTIKEP